MSEPSIERDPFEMVAESFLARYRAGERPSVNDLAARHPELAEQIRDLLPALVMVERDMSIDREPDAGLLSASARGQTSQLGDYRIIREIGRGGMGVVYEAEQVSLGRRVALKVLPAHVSGDRNALERFRREAKAAARLHHTNIVPVFEVGRSGDVAYYTMQFIQGQGLDQVIDELRRLRGPERKGDAQGGSSRPASTRPKTNASIDGPPSRELEHLAESLKSGRLPSEGPGSAGTASAMLQGVGARPPDHAASTVAETWDSGRHLPKSKRPPRAETSSPAVLPGGTAVSTVGSSSRRQAFFRSAAQIGRQAAQGLAHAHARGIVHRDIKPSNLLLDTAGVIWIADFGLAKSNDDALTATGDVLGTFRYMAPERFRGEGDARADIYALGLTLYELLTLKTAHHSSDRLRLIERIKSEEPTRPRTLDDRIPRDLETIVLKAIDKDRDRRYQTADAMAEDLRRYLADEPIEARQASAAERCARWARRNPANAALGGVLAAVLILTTLGSILAAGRFARLAQSERESARSERSARQEVSRRAKAELAAWAEADQARAASEMSRVAAQSETYHRILSRARSLRVGRLPGWRDEALSELARVATMPALLRDLPELRTEAAAALGTPDIRLVSRIDLPASDLASFAFSPDGRTLLTAGQQTGLQFWDVAGKRHVSSVEALTVGESTSDKSVYLPDGQGLAVGTRDRGVVFTDLRGSLTSRAPITQGSSRPTRLAIDENGKRIAVAWSDGSGITVDDLASGARLGRFAGSIFAISPDGRYLAREEGSEIVLLPIASGEPRIVLGRHSGAAALTFSPDGTMLAAAFLDHTAVLWDVVKREQFGTLRGHRERVFDVAFSPDGEWIATGSLDYTARIWETRTGRNIATLSGPAPVHRVLWSPTGEFLATSTHSNREVFLYLITGRNLAQRWLTRHKVELLCVASDPRRERIATSGYTELISWDLASSRPTPVTFAPNPGAVTSMAYSPDGSLLATASWLGTDPREILIRSGDTGQVQSRTSVPQLATSLTFDPASERLAIGDIAGSVVVWDIATSREGGRFATGSRVSSMIFLDRRRLVTHGKDAVLVFDLDSGQLIRKVDLSGGNIRKLAADRKLTRLVVGFESGAIGSLSLPDLVPGPRLEQAHEGSVECLALSPDGRRLATGGADHRVVLRDAMTFERLLDLPVWTGNLRDLTFDIGGRRLAIVGTDCDVDLWDLAELSGGLAAIGLAWERPSPAVAPYSSRVAERAQVRPAFTVIRRPGTTDPEAFAQARQLVLTGVGAFNADRWADSIRDLESARDRLRTLHQEAPGDSGVASQLGMSLGFLSSVLRNEHRPVDALKALEEARRVFDSIGQPTSLDLYNTACVYAGLSALAGPGNASPNPPGREALADRAMGLLKRALSTGMTDFALLDRDHDLDPLRGRPDFRALILDRGFPRDPIANPSRLASPEKFEESRQAELAALSAAVARRSSDYAVYYTRGEFFARQNDWSRAATDFSRALELHPPETWLDGEKDTKFGFVTGLALLRANDLDGHRRVALAMLRNFAESDNASSRDRTAKINVFADPPAEALKKINDLADRSVRLGRGSPGLCWLQLTRGMASFRSGDFASAEAWLRRSEGSGLDDLSRAVARFYLAMAENRLGHPEQARSLFHQACQELDTKTPAGDWAARWFPLCETVLARREAEALIFHARSRDPEPPVRPE